MSDTYKVKCDQCNVAVIQGQPCHEHGCPNGGKLWVVDKAQGEIRPDSSEAEPDLDSDSELI